MQLIKKPLKFLVLNVADLGKKCTIFVLDACTRSFIHYSFWIGGRTNESHKTASTKCLQFNPNGGFLPHSMAHLQRIKTNRAQCTQNPQQTRTIALPINLITFVSREKKKINKLSIRCLRVEYSSMQMISFVASLFFSFLFLFLIHIQFTSKFAFDSHLLRLFLILVLNFTRSSLVSHRNITISISWNFQFEIFACQTLSNQLMAF